MKRWLIVLLLCISATAFSASLLRYGEDHMTTHPDYSVSRTIPDDPVVNLGGNVVDVLCVQGYPCDAIAFATIRGLYPRQGVPRLTALLGGVVLAPLLVLVAINIAIRRRWLQILSSWIAIFILSGMMLQVPGKYFNAGSKADLDRKIAADAIYVAEIDSGLTCLGRTPCIKNPYYAFTRGVFTPDGVPRPLAIGLGMVVPGLLAIGSVALALRRRPRRIRA